MPSPSKPAVTNTSASTVDTVKAKEEVEEEEEDYVDIHDWVIVARPKKVVRQPMFDRKLLSQKSVSVWDRDAASGSQAGANTNATTNTTNTATTTNSATDAKGATANKPGVLEASKSGLLTAVPKSSADNWRLIHQPMLKLGFVLIKLKDTNRQKVMFQLSPDGLAFNYYLISNESKGKTKSIPVKGLVAIWNNDSSYSTLSFGLKTDVKTLIFEATSVAMKQRVLIAIQEAIHQSMLRPKVTSAYAKSGNDPCNPVALRIAEINKPVPLLVKLFSFSKTEEI